MPSGDQPVSSSPIRMRFGSADSVVLPVPDRPKNSALSAVLADVGRAMHRHHALRRQVEVQRGEHRLLHLARVGRAADQHDLAGEIDRDLGVGAFAAAVTLMVRLERRHIDDGHVRHEARELRALRTDQELADEQRVPGVFGVDADLDAILRIGAAVEVLRVQRLALRMREEVGEHVVEVLLALLAVAVPPDRVLGERIDLGVLVLRRAAGVVAGLGAERAAGDDGRLAVADRVLVERRVGQVPVDRSEVLEAELVGAIGGVAQTGFFHGNSSSRVRPLSRPDLPERPFRTALGRLYP